MMLKSWNHSHQEVGSEHLGFGSEHPEFGSEHPEVGSEHTEFGFSPYMISNIFVAILAQAIRFKSLSDSS